MPERRPTVRPRLSRRARCIRPSSSAPGHAGIPSSASGPMVRSAARWCSESWEFAAAGSRSPPRRCRTDTSAGQSSAAMSVSTRFVGRSERGSPGAGSTSCERDGSSGRFPWRSARPDRRLRPATSPSPRRSQPLRAGLRPAHPRPHRPPAAVAGRLEYEHHVLRSDPRRRGTGHRCLGRVPAHGRSRRPLSDADDPARDAGADLELSSVAGRAVR